MKEASLTTIDLEDFADNASTASAAQVAVSKIAGQSVIPVAYKEQESLILGFNAEGKVHLATNKEALDIALRSGMDKIAVVLLPKELALECAKSLEPSIEVIPQAEEIGQEVDASIDNLDR